MRIAITTVTLLGTLLGSLLLAGCAQAPQTAKGEEVVEFSITGMT